MVDINNFHLPLYEMDFTMSNSPRFGKSLIKYPNLIQHSPHPTRVRHIKSLMGNSICVVDTEDLNTCRNYKLIFPPNNYNDVRIRNSSNKFNFPPDRNYQANVTARPNLDTIFSLKHFTGLQNTSFRGKSNFTLQRIKDLCGWENQLENLKVSILDPFYKEDKIENVKRLISTEIQSHPSSPMRKMYSSSGRILPSIKSSRPTTSPVRKQSSRLSTARSFHPEPDLEESSMNTQIFHILGGILQTGDEEVIKTWLLTATEREKALMIDIVRSALLDKQELNIFVNDSVPEQETQIIYTPNKNYTPKLPVILENSNPETINHIVVHSDPSPRNELIKTRPPTSSTFRSTEKSQIIRPLTRDGSQWVPSESLVIN